MTRLDPNAYWVGAGTTDMARQVAVAQSEESKKVGLETSYHEAAGAHYWFIGRQFLGEYGSLLFK